MSTFRTYAQDRGARSPDSRQLQARCRLAVDMVFDLVKHFDPGLDDEQIWWRMIRSGFLMQVGEFVDAVAQEGPAFWAAKIVFQAAPTDEQVAAVRDCWAGQETSAAAAQVSA